MASEPILEKVVRHKQIECALLAVLGVLPVAANSESIGRVELDLSGTGWTPLTSFTTEMKFMGGPPRNLALQNNAYLLPGKNGAPKAILIITSSLGGHSANVQWITTRCPESRSKYFTNDFGSNQTNTTRECLIVNSNFGTFNYFKEDSEFNNKFMHAVREKEVKLFRGGYSMRSEFGGRNGTYLKVNLMTLSTFNGLSEKPVMVSNAHDVQPALIVWGEALHKSIRESVQSISGQLVLPRIEFND